jgi:hypothetical protein
VHGWQLFVFYHLNIRHFGSKDLIIFIVLQSLYCKCPTKEINTSYVFNVGRGLLYAPPVISVYSIVLGVWVSHVLPFRLLGVTLKMLEPILVSWRCGGLWSWPDWAGLPFGLPRGLGFGLKFGEACNAGFGRPVG